MAGLKQMTLQERREAGLAVLVNGGTYAQHEFHELYEQLKGRQRWQLIEGVAYMTPPPGVEHGESHGLLITLLGIYAGHTPGTRMFVDVDTILNSRNEVEPDGTLMILPEAGGQARRVDQTIAGAPELAAEVTYSRRSVDLGDKKIAYTKAGVLEYYVIDVSARRLHAFSLQSGTELVPDAQGILRSVVFPGLWIHAPSLVNNEYLPAMNALQDGLRTAEHAEFVARLAARMKP